MMSMNFETKTEILKALTDYVNFWNDVYQDARSESKETCVQYGADAMNGDRKAGKYIIEALAYEDKVLTILRNGLTALEVIKTKEVNE